MIAFIVSVILAAAIIEACWFLHARHKRRAELRRRKIRTFHFLPTPEDERAVRELIDSAYRSPDAWPLRSWRSRSSAPSQK